MVLFIRDGFWHRAEYVRGKGEIISVLTDGYGAIQEGAVVGLMDVISKASWGEQSTDEKPRQVVRTIRTYRRRLSSRIPFVVYPKTSAGYAAHILGIDNPNLATPAVLADYCERDGLPPDMALAVAA